jgi:hypothetical protein
MPNLEAFGSTPCKVANEVLGTERVTNQIFVATAGVQVSSHTPEDDVSRQGLPEKQNWNLLQDIWQKLFCALYFSRLRLFYTKVIICALT